MKLRTDLIRSSFDAASVNIDAFSIHFYRNLFQSHPEVRAMFPEDMSAQRKKLMQTLAAMVGRIEQPETMVPMLANLGARHVEYGTQAAHYPVVAMALIAAFRDVLGEDFDAETEEAWTTALNWIAEQMIAGARAMEASVA